MEWIKEKISEEKVEVVKKFSWISLTSHVAKPPYTGMPVN